MTHHHCLIVTCMYFPCTRMFTKKKRANFIPIGKKCKNMVVIVLYCLYCVRFMLLIIELILIPQKTSHWPFKLISSILTFHTCVAFMVWTLQLSLLHTIQVYIFCLHYTCYYFIVYNKLLLECIINVCSDIQGSIMLM